MNAHRIAILKDRVKRNEISQEDIFDLIDEIERVREISQINYNSVQNLNRENERLRKGLENIATDKNWRIAKKTLEQI